MISVFFLTPSEHVRVELRRFTYSGTHTCPKSQWGCDATAVALEQDPRNEWLEERDGYLYAKEGRPEFARNGGLWPERCEACGQPFPDEAEWQTNARELHTGAPSGRPYTLQDAPVGAMWDATWMHGVPAHTGPDGLALIVRTPGGDWHIDSQASNCTRPGDLTHKCWVRHGDPRDPHGERTGVRLHVDKRGETCAAGAGSIALPKWHGFLHHGHLVPA